MGGNVDGIGTKTNVVIPMAGKGKRFLDKGYTTPKPLLEAAGKTMVENVIENMKGIPNAHFIFIMLREHQQHGLDKLLQKAAPGCDIIYLDGITQGAACTVLKAEKLIDNDCPLVIKDCDQILDWVPRHFFAFMGRNNADAGIMTIHTDDPGFSFVEPKKEGADWFHANRTAEKMVISKEGATGLYYFAKGSHFVKYANEMVEKNIRTNGEFYICPVYNQLIEGGLRVLWYPVAQMLSLGIPEDFERNKNKIADILAAGKS